jgi:hypothetical protein
MTITLKINPKTGVIYLPKVLEDGFCREVDAFGAGPVLVTVRPDANLETASTSEPLGRRRAGCLPHVRRFNSTVRLPSRLSTS